MMCRIALLFILTLVAWPERAWADGPQFNGGCTTLSWTANTEPDLGGYRLYDRVSLSASPVLILTTGIQTSIPCSAAGFNQGQHYLSLSAFDINGNESLRTSEVPFVIVVGNQISDLRVTVVNSTDMTLTWTEVDGGLGAPASYDVRFATPTINWGSAASVSSGTCTTTVAGTTIGASKSCTVTGLSTTTPYQFQLVPFRGVLDTDAIFGPLSDIANGTTGSTPPPATRSTIFVDDFNRSNGGLVTPWMHSYSGQQNGTINSNAVRPAAAGGAQTVEIYNATTPGDQWAHVGVPTIQGAGAVSVFTRLRWADSPNFAGYECRAYRNSASLKSEIAYRVAGVGGSTTLASDNSVSWASGDELDCEVQGTTIKLSRTSGGTTTLLLTATDSRYSTGKAGFGVFSAILGDGIIDNFSMGKFSVAAVTEPCGCDEH